WAALKVELAARDRRGSAVRGISNGATLPGEVGTATLDRLGLAPRSYVLSVGRLVPDKGWDVALAGIERLGRDDLDYVVVGDARADTAYARGVRAHAARLATPVRMVGTVAPADLDGLYPGPLAPLT